MRQSQSISLCSDKSGIDDSKIECSCDSEVVLWNALKLVSTKCRPYSYIVDAQIHPLHPHGKLEDVQNFPSEFPERWPWSAEEIAILVIRVPKAQETQDNFVCPNIFW